MFAPVDKNVGEIVLDVDELEKSKDTSNASWMTGENIQLSKNEEIEIYGEGSMFSWGEDRVKISISKRKRDDLNSDGAEDLDSDGAEDRAKIMKLDASESHSSETEQTASETKEDARLDEEHEDTQEEDDFFFLHPDLVCSATSSSPDERQPLVTASPTDSSPGSLVSLSTSDSVPGSDQQLSLDHTDDWGEPQSEPDMILYSPRNSSDTEQDHRYTNLRLTNTSCYYDPED